MKTRSYTLRLLTIFFTSLLCSCFYSSYAQHQSYEFWCGQFSYAPNLQVISSSTDSTHLFVAGTPSGVMCGQMMYAIMDTMGQPEKLYYIQNAPANSSIRAIVGTKNNHYMVIDHYNSIMDIMSTVLHVQHGQVSNSITFDIDSLASINTLGYAIATDGQHVWVAGEANPEGVTSYAFLAKFDTTLTPLIIKKYQSDPNPSLSRAVKMVVGDNHLLLLQQHLDKSTQYPDIYLGITKTDKDGNVQWFRSFDMPYTGPTLLSDYPVDVVEDEQGNVYVLGEAHEANITSAPDHFLVKLDANGNVLWHELFDNASGAKENYATALHYHQQSLYVTGSKDSVAGNSRVGIPFVSQIDTDGNVMQSIQLDTVLKDNSIIGSAVVGSNIQLMSNFETAANVFIPLQYSIPLNNITNTCRSTATPFVPVNENIVVDTILTQLPGILVSTNSAYQITGGTMPIVSALCSGAVGIDEEVNDNNLLLYPTPVKSVLTLMNGTNHYGKASIINLQGRVVKTIDLVTGKQSVPVTSLAPGVYFLHFSAGGRYITRKLVKE